MQGYEARHAEATEIAAHLARAVGEICPTAPPSHVWQAVEAPDRAFTSALARWQRTGHPEDKQRVREAYRALVDAWRTALVREAA